MAKCLEDALRAVGVLKDDDPKYVKKTSIEVVVAAPSEHGSGDRQYGTTIAGRTKRIKPAKKDFVEIIINPI